MDHENDDKCFAESASLARQKTKKTRAPRRTFSDRFKLSVLQTIEQGEKQSLVCEKHQLPASVVSRWRKQFGNDIVAETANDYSRKLARWNDCAEADKKRERLEKMSVIIATCVTPKQQKRSMVDFFIILP